MEGGFEVLSRMTGSNSWGMSKEVMMRKYSKSLYVYACVSKIAEKVATNMLQMYKILNSRGDTKEIYAHPLLDILYKPNPFQTKTEFWELTIINWKLTGEAFWYKVRNTRGNVVELWNLRPDLMKVIGDPTNFVKEYRLRKNDGSEQVFAPEDVVHFKSPDPLDPLHGMSALLSGSSRVETEDYATAYQRDFFLNSARPDAVIKSPDQNLDQAQKDDIREGWEKRHKGVGKSSKVAILEGGLDYQVISLSQKDMDYIQSLKATRDDILVMFKIPKVVLSIVEDVNRANAETGMRIFLTECIKPDVDKIVEKINEQMVYADFGDNFYVEAEDPTPENRDMLLKDYETGLKNNYLLINEVRLMENMLPVKGGWSMYMPVMNQAVGGLPQQGEGKMIGGVSEKDAYIGGAPDRLKKRYDFRGRYWLKMKFEMRESMEKAAALAVRKMARRSVRGKGKGGRKAAKRSLITDAGMRKAYAEMILKQIAAGEAGLKPMMDEFAKAQGERVIRSLEAVAKVGKAASKKAGFTVTAVFDKTAEDEMLVHLVIPGIAGIVEQAAKDALAITAPAESYVTTKTIRKFIDDRAEFLADTVNNTTIQGLETTLSEGIAASEGIAELRARVDEVYGEFPLWRTEMIARTEATAANSKGTVEGFRQSDVANGKEWINAGDGRVRPEHQEGGGVGGEIVALDETFSNGLDFPSEPNCRCVIGPAFLEG